MTDRYFERWWEESYYIFDSETISEEEFDEKVEYEDYQAFADSMAGAEVLDKLNYLHHCKDEADKLIAEGIELARENRKLKRLIKKVLETTPIEHNLAIKLKNSVRELYDTETI